MSGAYSHEPMLRLFTADTLPGLYCSCLHFLLFILPWNAAQLDSGYMTDLAFEEH